MYYDQYVPLNLVRECIGRFKPQQNKHKIIVITNGRSGSTLLTESIGQIEGVDNFNEIIHWPFISFRALQNFFANKTRGQYLCYKLLGYQLEQYCNRHDLTSIRAEVLDPAITVIFLERNRQSRALSKKLAFASGQWHSRKNSIPTNIDKTITDSVQPIALTEQDVQQELDNETRLDQYFVQIGLYERDDRIHLYYDLHLKSPEALQATIEHQCKHLSSPVPTIVAKTQKVITS